MNKIPILFCMFLILLISFAAAQTYETNNNFTYTAPSLGSITFNYPGFKNITNVSNSVYIWNGTVGVNYTLSAGESWALYQDPTTCVMPTNLKTLTLLYTSSCNGIFNLPGGNGVGALKFNLNNSILDCNGGMLLGNNTVNSIGIDPNFKSNLTIKNCKIGGNYKYGIELYSSTKNVTVLYSEFTGTYLTSGAGLYILETKGHNISYNNFNVTSPMNLKLDYTDMENRSSLTYVSYNNFSQTTPFSSDCMDTIFENNIFKNNTAAPQIIDGIYCQFNNNLFIHKSSNGGKPFNILNLINSSIYKNSFFSNNTPEIPAIKFFAGTGNNITGNQIYDATDGLFLYSNNNYISNNTIIGTVQTGTAILNYGNNSVIDGNFIDNFASGIITVGTSNMIFKNDIIKNITNKGFISTLGGNNLTIINITVINTHGGVFLEGSNSTTTHPLSNVTVNGGYCSIATGDDCFTNHGDASNNQLGSNFTWLNLVCTGAGEQCVDMVSGNNIYVDSVFSNNSGIGILTVGNNVMNNVVFENLHSFNDGLNNPGGHVINFDIALSNITNNYIIKNSVIEGSNNTYNLLSISNSSNILFSNVTFISNNSNIISYRYAFGYYKAENILFQDSIFYDYSSNSDDLFRIYGHQYGYNISLVNSKFYNKGERYRFINNSFVLNITNSSSSNLSLRYDVLNSNLTMNFNGLKSLFIENTTITIYNLTPPYNDIRNSSNRVILASNQNTYSITLNPNQQIEVGDFPVVLTVLNHSILHDKFNVSITLDDSMNATLHVSTSASFTTYMNFSDSAFSTSHELQATGLSPGTLYYYQVNGTNSVGGEFNTTIYSVTTATTYCGDNIFQATNDESVTEQCDASDLNSQTCLSVGFTKGTLTCDSSCQFITTDCRIKSQMCQNNLVPLSGMATWLGLLVTIICIAFVFILFTNNSINLKLEGDAFYATILIVISVGFLLGVGILILSNLC